MHETTRQSQSAGSSSKDRSPAFRAGEITDGSGCIDRLQCIVRFALERRMEARRRQCAVCATTFRTAREVGAPANRATVGCTEAGNPLLGLLAVGLDVPVGAGFGSATVWRRVPCRLCGHAASQAG